MLDGSGLLPSQELPGTVAAIVEAVRGLGLEGVIAKRKDSLYEPGERSDAWQKLKLENQQEFVIGGYRLAGWGGVDALLVGYYDDTGLRFAGKVRAGFVPHLRREVFKALKPHHVDECPFVDLPNSKSSRWGGGVTADEMREMQWVKPQIVVQIRFVEWTAEDRLRHAAFLGLRFDKSAREVRRERPCLTVSVRPEASFTDSRLHMIVQEGKHIAFPMRHAEIDEPVALFRGLAKGRE